MTAGERVMRSEIARLQSDSDKPVAVIFNLGVNDLSVIIPEMGLIIKARQMHILRV